MYPGYSTQKVLHEERVRNLLAYAPVGSQNHTRRASRIMHLVVKLALACVTLFSIVLLPVQTPIHADADLGTLLLPPTDCRAPCFMGIRPGVTTLDAAAQLLQANPLIQSIRINSFARYDEQSIEASVALAPERAHLFLNAQQRIVESITLSGINLSLDEVVRMLGEPNQLVLNNRLHLGFTTYSAFYPQYGMVVVVDIPKGSADLNMVSSVERFVSVSIASARRYTEQTAYYLPGTYTSSEA